MRWRRTLLALWLAAALVPALMPPTGARAQTPCSFVLGFQTLAALLGPATVGTCLENQHYSASGNALQQTTNGLLVWRKIDNWTAFTDGYRTWVKGPFGLQQRLNTQRFRWEPNPERLAIIPPLVPGDRCHTAGLVLDLQGTDAGAGNIVATFRFTNVSGVPCTLYGFVGMQRLDATNNPLPTVVAWGTGWVIREGTPTLVRVPANGIARFDVHWEQVPVGDETTCIASDRMAVIPPDEYSPLVVDVTARACGGGRLEIGAIQPAL